MAVDFTQAPFDEHGAPTDGDLPPYVTNAEEWGRWRMCVQIAERITRKSDPDPEERFLASELFFSPMPSGDETSPLQETAFHAFAARFNELLHPRARSGQFTVKPKELKLAKRPPASPGSSQSEFDRMADWDPQPGPVARQILGGAKDTAEIYALTKHEVPSSPGSSFRVVPYRPGRQELHDAITERELRGKTKPRHKALAIFTAGGPASGKTTFLRKDHPKLLPDEAHTVIIDKDDLMKALPEYDRMHEAGDPYAAEALHQEAGDLAARIAHEAAERGLNVVVEGTGDGEPGEFRELLEHFKPTHNVGVLYVNAPIGQSIRQNIERWDKDKERFVRTSVLREKHQKVSAIFMNEISKLPWLHALDVYDAEHGHIATKQGDAVVPLHDDAYAAFMDKAKPRG